MKQKVDLLKESILPALTKLAVPIMATSLVQMAYNLTVWPVPVDYLFFCYILSHCQHLTAQNIGMSQSGKNTI